VRDRRVAPDLAAVARRRAAIEEALRAVDRADRVEHRERRLVARARRDLGLGHSGPRVALEQRVREMPPANALPDERDLRLGLDRHLLLDPVRDPDDGRARELAERRPAVAEDPRVPVLVRPDAVAQPERGDGGGDRLFRARVARVLEVVLDAVEHRLRLGVLDLEPRHDERALPVRAEHERDRPFSRDERKAGVVQDVVRVEEHDAAQVVVGECLEERGAPGAMLVGGDRDRGEHQGGA
jgi:hypothetical protein